MTAQEKRELSTALESLFDLDRFSSCSDRYFRQVFTQKITAVKAGGYREKLLAEAETDEAMTT